MVNYFFVPYAFLTRILLLFNLYSVLSYKYEREGVKKNENAEKKHE